ENTTSDVPSMVRKLGAGRGGGVGGAAGAVMASVRSSTSAEGGAGWLVIDFTVTFGGPSRSASIASTSSWLLGADGTGATGLAGAGGGVADFDAVAGCAGRPGAGTVGGLGGAAASGGLAGLLTSSSAMIRRMEARISSIDGSCAFAACVIL